MKNLSKLLFLLLAIAIASCSKNDKIEDIPLRDFAVQYVADLDSIDKYIDTHYMTVTPNLDVTFTKIGSSAQPSIRNQSEFPLQFKMVKQGEIDYKVYYINLREGGNRQPTKMDSLYIAYQGNYLSGNNFNNIQTPTWINLYTAIKGWKEIMPMFKTGFYDANADPSSPTNFTDFGAGVLFVPSALAYYGKPPMGSNVPPYSPLIFTFKLMELKYQDHDGDGILSKDEVANPGDDPELYDTDGDGLPNFFDKDDDGDGYLTKFEIRENGVITFPTCPGGTISKHLDPTCH